MKSFLIGMAQAVVMALSWAGSAQAAEPVVQASQYPSDAWLRDDSRQSARVLNFLRTENQHTAKTLSPQQPLETALRHEWQSRQATIAERPWHLAGTYNYRLSKGVLWQQHAKSGTVKTVADLSKRSQHSDYYHLGSWQVSPDHRLLAITEDRRGDRNYALTVLDLRTGQIKATLTEAASTDLAWSQDSQSLYFVENESGTYRPFAVRRWSLTTATQTTIFREDNPAWLVSVYAATADQYLLIQSNNHNTSEQWLIQSNRGQSLGVIRPRESGIEYYADVRHGRLFLSSNLNGDFALYQSALPKTAHRGASSQAAWQPLWQPENNQHIKNWLLFPEHIVLEVTAQNLSRLVVLNYQGVVQNDSPITPAGGVAWLSGNTNRYGQSVMIRRMSMTQPPQWQAFSLKQQTFRVVAEDRYPDFAPDNYRTEQIQVRHQGVSVPVTLAYRADRLTQTSPVILYGYGAYGTPVRPYFMPQIISLLDRGVIYAIAHVRGGGYLGPDWYTQGKGVNKPRAFDDFLAVAEVMKAFHHGQNRPILALGGSAGGTLVAGALNRQPDLFSGAVLQVPFVDVIATMSDPSLPLTRQEYAEWGDPSDPAQRAVMASYSPNDNISAQAYPPMLVTAGLYDTQVPYWEPARWVMRVRENSLNPGPYLLQTDLSGGHRQDARQAQQQQAREYAFLLSLVSSGTESP
ncbi:prolyl oligopeptidase family serine peptidase [Photobacterium sp. 1_MG-2023]|uniref:prolyl oligopeptidase family serine peptidase n=1 Tax=Photobacterium sp. 1_MG-2023 TaxID=3062646 RepID=UPI0026E2E62A|nr:prolyl oligopeptidase family serine peptidase [Photobacterium sp. 1_MG-2023]MDO6706496.1 prolyl oligopeptidase family serine peptidase [Photobacterium sp. 1_MG-2023]